MKRKSGKAKEALRGEYKFDYSRAIRGKYDRRLFREGANVAVLDPDVARAFPNSTVVNEALLNREWLASFLA